MMAVNEDEKQDDGDKEFSYEVVVRIDNTDKEKQTNVQKKICIPRKKPREAKRTD
jgi:hypothetical protein